MSVSGSPFDFRAHKPFDTTWDADHHQLELAGGYDHNWILNSNGRAPTFAAEVTESTSGRTLRILTTEPGIQFYSGNFLDGSFLGRGGQSYAKRSGFCLETQHFPDSPNQPTFPSTELRPEKPFQSDTIFVFNEGLS
jgi:aldose 1-epimerase